MNGEAVDAFGRLRFSREIATALPDRPMPLALRVKP